MEKGSGITTIEFPSDDFEDNVTQLAATGDPFFVRLDLNNRKINSIRRMLQVMQGGSPAASAWKTIFDGPKSFAMTGPLFVAMEQFGYKLSISEKDDGLWVYLRR